MNRPLLSLRAALVFLFAGLTGAGSGVLTAMSGSGNAQSLLYGATVFGLAVSFFDRIIGPGHECAAPVTGPSTGEPVHLPSIRD
ncbi:hypothetical protein ACFRCG_12750 [Embleya sp. NPDC056575]|uniref:hypothetical protein n=1 Tax=unclassified Embleya TaxID=2699296 RepID=UPI0036CB2093